ncbi:MAG: Maf family protein [Spirochaetales bacterium]|nr:Maf family protein [Spirochaetales bacterium]
MDGIVLASASPRRRELLRRMGLEPVVCAADIDESFPPGRNDFGRLCSALARRKIEAVLEKPEARGRRWFLGADTVVIINGGVLGKPKDKEEARGFLGILQGAAHRVVTGVAFYDRQSGRFHLAAESAGVRIAKMSAQEIDWYLDSGEWQGVAGGYRIQEKGACFIASIRGDYTNVMGLPIRLVYGILRANNYPFGIKSSGMPV